MKLSATYSIPAARDKVFQALNDPAILQQAIDGCEKMVKTAENAYDAHLKIGLAGLKGSYVGKVLIKDLTPPEAYTLVIEGKGAPGFVKGTARVHLTEAAHSTGSGQAASSGSGQAPATELRCESDAQVGGLIAAVGSRLIEVAAKKMMDDFFRKFAELVRAS